MQSNKQLNEGSKQYFNLLKTSLNKKNVKHIDLKTYTHTHTHTYTHTHTLNKSNQFYISKTS